MTADSPGAPAFERRPLHPPEAVLYLQLSMRRRVVSALLVGTGLAPAAALAGHGVVTQEMWPMGAALAGAVAGFVLMWLYQRRERPLQIEENRERAKALVAAFADRLELRRGLALTRAGIEVGAETVTWQSIASIDASLGQAMSKRLVLVLGPAGANRHIRLSLAGLAEQPAVAYAVTKMLWMRHAKPLEVRRSSPPAFTRPLFFVRTRSGLGTLLAAIGGIGVAGGIAGSFPLFHGGHPWLGVICVGIGIGVLFGASALAGRADGRKAERDQERADALEASDRATSENFELRRKTSRVWPAIVTALFVAPALIFFALGDAIIAQVFLLFAFAASLIAWSAAWWLGRGTIATLTSTGIVIRGEEIPWQDVAGIDLTIVPKVETGLLVLALRHPRTARTPGQRLNSWLSRGMSDREIVVSLARSAEEPGVVRQLVESRWEGAIGQERAAAARHRQIAETIRAGRTWKQFSREEKSRSLKVAFAIFAVLALTLFGITADFEVSDRWSDVSLGAACVLTIAGVAKLVRSRVFASLRNRQGTATYIVLFLMLSSMVCVMLWAIIGLALPDVFTRTLGRAEVVVVSYDKHRFPGSEGCPYPLGINLDPDRPYRFCAAPDEFAALPERGTVRLDLRSSRFGVHIVSVSTFGN
jgi:hypothetical protein